MKVGIVTEYFYPTLGGITENVYHMAKEFLARGIDLRIITGKKNGPMPISDEVKRRMIYIGKSVPTFFNGSCGVVTTGFSLSRKMREVIRSEQFDILHLHSPLFPTLPTIANIQSDIPMAATYHTCTNITLLYKLCQKWLQLAIDRIDLNIAVSKICAEENLRFFKTNFEILPNGVDVDWWAGGEKIKKFDDDKINIVFLGRPDERNGLDKLIRAFATLRKSHNNIRLIIVGDGPLRFYFEKLVPDDIKKDVFFEGSAVETRRDYLKTAHIMCFCPSIASFGITILEGMSAGKALVASDIEAFRDLVTNEESAMLVDPMSEEELEVAIERLVLDKSLREKIGVTASEHVRKYDWKHVAQLHLDKYAEIL